MREITCIVCPVGCSLAVDDAAHTAADSALSVSGNQCPRGAVYAQEEIRSPKRVVTATCAIAGDSYAVPRSAVPHRVPVKTSAPCPKEKISDLLADIYGIRVALPVHVGGVILANWKGSGIDVVATRSVT